MTVRWLVAFAVAAVAQVLLVARADPFSLAALLAVVALPVAALALRPSSPSLSTVAGVASVGGLAMVLGAMVDVGSGSALPACHAGASWQLLSWANALMVLACLAVDRVHCRRSWLALATCSLAMLAGMVAGARWLAPLAGATLDPSTAHHCAMVIGMMGGSLLAHAITRNSRDASSAPPEPASLYGRRHPVALPKSPRA